MAKVMFCPVERHQSMASACSACKAAHKGEVDFEVPLPRALAALLRKIVLQAKAAQQWTQNEAQAAPKPDGPVFEWLPFRSSRWRVPGDTDLDSTNQTANGTSSPCC